MSFEFDFDPQKFTQDLKRQGYQNIQERQNRVIESARSMECSKHHKKANLVVSGRHLESSTVTVTCCCESFKEAVLAMIAKC